MVDRVEKTKTVTDNGVMTETVRTTTDEPVATTAPASSTAARVVWFIAGVIIALLAFRFVLILLGANSSNGFVNLVYTLSYPFAVPFFGMFNYDLEYGVSRAEISTLVAIAVYALVAAALSYLVTIRRSRTV